MTGGPTRTRPGAGRQLLITRPEAEAAEFAATLTRCGFTALSEPLLTIVPRAEAHLDLTDVQAVLATSRNGVRALAALTSRRAIRLLAVGESTAALARAEGYTPVSSAGGDVNALADLAARELRPEDGVLLHVSGEAAAGNLVHDLAERGFSCRRAVLYEAQPSTALSARARKALAGDGLAGAVFFSPRTAATFVSLARAAGLAAACAKMTAYCLSGAVAAEAERLSWRRVKIAARPDQRALLALLGDEDETE